MEFSNASDQKATIDEENQAATPLREQFQQIIPYIFDILQQGKKEKATEFLMSIFQSERDKAEHYKKLYEKEIRAKFASRSEKLKKKNLMQLSFAFGVTPEEAAQPDPKLPVVDVQDEIEEKEEETSKKSNTKKRKKHLGRGRLNPNLNRRIIHHLVPDDERHCLHCGTLMECIGHIDKSKLQYVPAYFEWIVDRCEKLACTSCKQDITTATAPSNTLLSQEETKEEIQEKQQQEVQQKQEQRGQNIEGIAKNSRRRVDISVIIQLLIAKACDALPIHRQREQWKRLGCTLPLNTMYDYFEQGCRIIEPVAQATLSAVLSSPIVGVDDTRLDWLDKNDKSARHRGHLWCFVGTSKMVAFDFTKTWRAEEVAPCIRAIQGYIQCDAYAGYSTMMLNDDGNKTPLVPPERRLGCLMHVRRPFHVAFTAGEKHAIIALDHIQKIYAIEAQARDDALSVEEIFLLRQRQSKPIVESFYAWVKQQQLIVRPTSYLAKAIHYALQQQEFIMRCFSDGRFQLDTGRVERQIRKPVIGRKNYLFTGSADAAQRLANLYTLVCSCQNLEINIRDFLTDVMTKLQAGFSVRDLNQLRPDVWAAKRAAALK